MGDWLSRDGRMGLSDQRTEHEQKHGFQRWGMLEYDSWEQVESPDGDCWGFVGPGLPHPAGNNGTYTGLASDPHGFRSWFNELVIR